LLFPKVKMFVSDGEIRIFSLVGTSTRGGHVTIDLSGRCAIVVGASSGIGRVVAAELSAMGARVGWCARRGDLVAAGIAESDGAGMALVADIATETGCQSLAEMVDQQIGQIDLVVICSGASGIRMLRDADADYWQHILRTNVMGPSLVIRHLFPHLEPNAVVAILSSEIVGRPYPGIVPYSASKAALEEVVRGWRIEHPEMRFARVGVGTTNGTDFIRDFDRELVGSLYGTWLAMGIIPSRTMEARDVGVSIARTFGQAVLTPGVDVQDLVLRSPGPPAAPDSRPVRLAPRAPAGWTDLS
jgi:NAD(P)-dependent dehydrogenase (short-subunit alcohol dehydrogenase family)